jgi:hypothetical protein
MYDVLLNQNLLFFLNLKTIQVIFILFKRG